MLDEVDRLNWRERRILTLRPGMTDWASLWNDSQDKVLAGAPDPNDAYLRVIRPHKLQLQLDYVDSRTFWGDLRILATAVTRRYYKSYRPAAIREYPTYSKLRADVARLVATEQIYRRAA